MRRSYTHSEGLKWLSLGHCKSHCLTDFTWWVHFPKCWSIIFILLFLFARLYIVFGFSVLLGDKTFLFYFFWYQLGSEPELSRVWSESTNLYTSWPSHPQAYCQLYLCLLHEQKGFAYFIHRAHHIFFFFFFFLLFKFHKIVWEQERPYRIQTMICVQMKLLAWFGNSPGNLLVNQGCSIQLIWFAPDCDCCFLMSPNKPNKGRNWSGVQSNCPKKKKNCVWLR